MDKPLLLSVLAISDVVVEDVCFDPPPSPPAVVRLWEHCFPPTDIFFLFSFLVVGDSVLLNGVVLDASQLDAGWTFRSMGNLRFEPDVGDGGEEDDGDE